MKVRIPHELVLKFLSYEGLASNIEIQTVPGMGGMTTHVPGPVDYNVVLDLTDYPESAKACSNWINIIQTYFKTSYKAFRIDIGPYEGLWPYTIDIVNNRIIVKFRVDFVNPKGQGWKDWFIQGDRIIAPK